MVIKGSYYQIILITMIIKIITAISVNMLLILIFQGLRGAQPDGLNAEYCVAILNNIYNVRNLLFITSPSMMMMRDGVGEG